MASGSDIRAGKAFVELYTKNSALMRGLDQAQKRLRDFGNGIAVVGKWMMGLGTAIIAPFIAATKHFTSLGDQLDKTASKLGISTNALSELGFAAEQTGVSYNTMAMAMQRMTRRVSEAARGTGEAKDALRELNLDAEALAKMTPDQALVKIAGAMQNVGSQSDKVRLAFKLFDSEGVALVNTLALGEEGLAAMREEAKRLGRSIGPEQAAAAAQMADAWNRVKSSVSGIFFQIGAAVANSGILDAVAKIISSARKWVEQNRDTVATVLKIAAGVAAAGAGIFAFGKIIVGVGAAIGGLHSFILWAVGGVQMLISVLGMVVSPALLIGAALVAAGAGLVYLARNTAVVQAVADAIAEFANGIFAMVKTIVADATTAWDGIAAAISAGDIGAAIKVVTTTVKLEWARATGWLRETWQGFLQIYADITHGIASVFINVVASIKSAWYGLTGYLTKLWERWKNSTFQEGLADWLAPLFAKMQGVSVEETRAELHRMFSDRRAAQPARDKEIDAQTKAAQEAIEADRKAQLEALAQGKSADDAARAAEIAAIKKQLEDAKKARDRAVAAAKAAGAAAASDNTKTAKKFGLPDFDIAQLAKASTAAVTFSASAAMGMGGGIQERILRANEKTFQFIGEQTTVLRNIEKNQVPLTMKG